MKNVTFLFVLLIGLMIVSCTQTNEELKPVTTKGETSETATTRDGSENDAVQIGIILDDGSFEFIVSEDELNEVFNYNIEENLGVPGSLEEATVVWSEDEENPEYDLIMSGTIEDGGSASLKAGVFTELDEETNLLVVMINLKPVRFGLCWSSNCNACKQDHLTPSGDCFCTPPNLPVCPYYPNPYITWPYQQ